MAVVNEKIPFEMWTGKKLNIKNLCIFDWDAFANASKYERRKLDSKTKKSILPGYSHRIKRCHLYYNEKWITFKSRDVKFNELGGGLNKNLSESKESEVEIEFQPSVDMRDNKWLVEQERWIRERRQPDWYGEWAYITQSKDSNRPSKALLRQHAEK